MSPDVVLSIAGTDSGGAAGLAADLTTFAALGAHGACVVTAVTAQDTTGVRAVHTPPLALLEAQLDAVFDDLPVASVKTGMLGTPDAVALVADRVARLVASHVPPSGRRLALVVDPVLVATSGAALANASVIDAYVEHLLPVATVITPNADEARTLLGHDDEPALLARELAALGPSVVLTGGGTDETCTDWVATGDAVTPLTHAAIATANDHGTGCTFSAALAVHLAHGDDLTQAARKAATFTTSRLALGAHWDLGRGRGPIAHTNPLAEPLDHV